MSTRDQPMNFFRSEKISLTEDNLVAEVEAGMRDFLRGDGGDLRRPARLPTTTDTVLEPSTVAAVNNINSLVERVAGPSLTEITKLISEITTMRGMLHAAGHPVR